MNPINITIDKFKMAQLFIYIYIYIYRVSHFKSSTLITFQDQRLKENDSDKSCREQRGLSNNDSNSTLKVIFKVI